MKDSECPQWNTPSKAPQVIQQARPLVPFLTKNTILATPARGEADYIYNSGYGGDILRIHRYQNTIMEYLGDAATDNSIQI